MNKGINKLRQLNGTFSTWAYLLIPNLYYYLAKVIKMKLKSYIAFSRSSRLRSFAFHLQLIYNAIQCLHCPKGIQFFILNHEIVHQLQLSFLFNIYFATFMNLFHYQFMEWESRTENASFLNRENFLFLFPFLSISFRCNKSA